MILSNYLTSFLKKHRWIILLSLFWVVLEHLVLIFEGLIHKNSPDNWVLLAVFIVLVSFFWLGNREPVRFKRILPLASFYSLVPYSLFLVSAWLKEAFYDLDVEIGLNALTGYYAVALWLGWSLFFMLKWLFSLIVPQKSRRR